MLSRVLQGRNPFFLEPAIILAITDGSKLTGSSGVQDEVGHVSEWARLEDFLRDSILSSHGFPILLCPLYPLLVFFSLDIVCSSLPISSVVLFNSMACRAVKVAGKMSNSQVSVSYRIFFPQGFFHLCADMN